MANTEPVQAAPGLLARWRAELHWLREVLGQGGIVVTTCDQRGGVLLRTIVQLDGDTTQIITPDLLGADPVARAEAAAAHLAALRAALATPLTRLLTNARIWRARITTAAVGAPLGVTAWHLGAVLLQGSPGTAALWGLALPYAPVLATPLIIPALRAASRASLSRLMRT